MSNPSRETLGLGLFAFLVLPAPLILYLGLASRLRAERLAILHALGAGWGWTTRFVLAEALLLLLPPILVLAAMWAVVAPRVDYLPFVRKGRSSGRTSSRAISALPPASF